MPNSDDYDERDDEQQQPNWRRDLERRAKAGDEAAAELAKIQAEAESAKRELAMRRANVDLDSPVGALFAKAYDGSLDHDTLTQQWSTVNPAANAQAAADAAAMARISAAQTGGVPSGAGVVDFEQELDAIPQIVNGAWNPDYQRQVLQATAAQAAREGREFVVSGGKVSAQDGFSMGPAIVPLSEG